MIVSLYGRAVSRQRRERQPRLISADIARYGVVIGLPSGSWVALCFGVQRSKNA